MPHATLPLYALSVFEAAARYQSFTKAANELCLTQGAVSKQVALLEAHLGYELFHRFARSLRLTPRGQMLHGYVQRAFGVLEQGLDATAMLSAPVNIKAPSCVVRWLLAALRDFDVHHPDIPIQLCSSHDHDADFTREDVDIAVTYKPVSALGQHETLLFEEQLTPVLSPELLAKSISPLRKPADLMHYPLLHPSLDKRDWRQWLAHRHESGVDARRGTVFDTLDQAMQAAAHGFGVTLGDITLLQEELATGRLLAPLPPAFANGFAYALACRTDCSHGVQVLRDWLIGKAVATRAA